MERETLEQVIAYLEERRLESLNFEAIETTEADPVMLDLAKMVVEEKIRDLEPKEGVGNIEVTINAAEVTTMVKDMVNQITEEFTAEQEEKAICLGLCELKIPQQLTEELEKIEKLKNTLYAKEDDMTIGESKITYRLMSMLHYGERLRGYINMYNNQLEAIKKIINRENESNAQKN